MTNLRQNFCLVSSGTARDYKDIYALVIASHIKHDIHTIIYFYENPDDGCDLKIEYNNCTYYGSSKRIQYTKDEKIISVFEELEDSKFESILNTISCTLGLGSVEHETSIFKKQKKMTNFEFYKDKILEIVENDTGFALKGNDLDVCDGTGCKDCGFHDVDMTCNSVSLKWLYEEYIPPKPKLTERERAYCVAVEKGWLARDRNGELYLYKEKPCKHSDDWNRNIEWSNLNPSFFPDFDFITWEDDEPYSIKEMLKWRVEG